VEHLAELVAALVFWRIWLSGAVALAIAFVLSLFIPSFGSGAWFSLAFVGVTVGFIWQAAIASAKEAALGRTVQPMSKFVAFIGIAAIGGVWGNLVAGAIGLAFAAAALILAPLLLAPVFSRVSKQSIRFGQITFTVVALLAGFVAPYAIYLLFRAEGF
jgi:hypothetical protein